MSEGTPSGTQEGQSQEGTPPEGGNEQQPENNTEQKPEEQAYYSVEDLMNLTVEDFPEFGDEVPSVKGKRPLNDWLQHVPSEVREHLANIRASYTRKTQAVSNEKKELAALREQLMSEKRSHLDTKESILKNPFLEGEEEGEEGTDYDVFTDDGRKTHLKKETREFLQEQFKPAQEKLALERRQLELDRFKMDNPEIKTDKELRLEMGTRLKANPALRLEDAFFISKGVLAGKRASEATTKHQETKKKRAETARKSSGGTRAETAPPKFKSLHEAFKYAKQQHGEK